MNLDSSGERGEAQVAEELTGLLGHAPAEWSAETLTHNVYSAVTAGIWRIRAGSASVVVLKVISSAGTAASEEWSSSEQSSHWNFWEREALAYKQGVTTVYLEAGISSPRLLALNRRPNGDVALWLEDVHSGGDSVPGTQPSHTNGSAP